MALSAQALHIAKQLKGNVRRWTFTIAVMGSVVAQPACGQVEEPSSQKIPAAQMEQAQRDVIFPNYKFKDGETLSALRLHFVTLGHKHTNAQGEVDNAIMLLHWTNESGQALLTSEYQAALFAPGKPLDVSRYFIIIPDDIGHGQSSKPSNALKARFPHYTYGDMVDLQHKVVTESLGIKHLHAIIGMSMGCMNAWQWAEDFPDAMDGIMPVACFPGPITGRNLLWRRMLIDGIRRDPAWANGNYEKQPPSAFQGSMLARMMIDGVPELQQEVPNAQAADGIIHGVEAQSVIDANDLLYAFESSRDFNGEPGLSRIKTKVFALNFADDEFYRDSLQTLQRDAQVVPEKQIVIRP